MSLEQSTGMRESTDERTSVTFIAQKIEHRGNLFLTLYVIFNSNKLYEADPQNRISRMS